MNTYSQNIKLLRDTLKMTQESFGKAIGVVKITVSQYEAGTRSPSEKTAERIVLLAKKQGIIVKVKYGHIKKFINLSFKP